MKYLNKKLFTLAFLALSSYGLAVDCSIDDCEIYSPDLCNDWFITADFIYWKAHANNLEYAYDVSPPSRGNFKELDWQWDPGFKFGIGYIFANTWDLYLNYTWYYTSAQGSASGPGDLFASFNTNIASTFAVSFASSKWQLHYHTLDFEIGDWVDFNCYFMFRPNVGLRAASTKDTDIIAYTLELGPSSLNYRQTFNGVGPKFGLNTNWRFWKNWSLFADGAWSLLWGQYDVKFLSEGVFGSINTTHRFNTLRILTDLKVGFTWEYLFCKCYPISLQLAWEHRLWFKHNEYQRTDSANACFRNNDGDLILYGLTLTACVKF